MWEIMTIGDTVIKISPWLVVWWLFGCGLMASNITNKFKREKEG